MGAIDTRRTARGAVRSCTIHSGRTPHCRLDTVDQLLLEEGSEAVEKAVSGSVIPSASIWNTKC
ncbi:uncharacterized protein PHALS_03271 [Plasmopara halstedii]|uniref:Uncharacterized protein n=1 Tax=Plasmopara halstedii TaxID=4781 RepID=A0A0P1AW76_PLAHL|nr:uncharacterized protein PHALS_03271 [Plasmopara halstedii]CEG46664.1 hypothetical protein PHALS_03271 [Plasmopara halstedii]|eukprot:XP_024583033.1 hypothetical protein PHALS_03271 [Plasmopara halstedii]